MKIPTRKVPRLVLVFLASFLLAACITKETPPTRFYVLGALPADAPSLPGAQREPPISVEVGPVRIPQYLQRPQPV